MGGYELRARLGEGGMGVVHLGQRPGERPVALKVLRPHIVGDDEARQRLAREVSSLGRIRSRRIAEIVDADPWGEIPYVATRYVPGLPLHDYVDEEGALTGEDLLWFAMCLAEALAAVHSVGVLHRDVKPSNVIMEGRTPILIDFGLARVADDPRLTMTGWLLGTPGYLAPEILHGEDATTASDVHAWAATVAFAGLGRAPFGRGPAMAIMDRVRRGEHELSGLDPGLRPLVEHALAPAATGRPSLPEVEEWLHDLSGRQEPSGPVTQPIVAARHQDLVDPTRIGSWPDGSTEVISQEYPFTLPPLVGTWERMRRAALLLAGGAVVVGAVVLAPYVTLLLSGIATWLLRSGSVAASSIDRRRQVRGTKWYDAPQVLLAAPWHLVVSTGGSVLLLLWSLGIASATALCCFAAAAPLHASLALVGTTFTAAMWWGPGSGRLRSPVRRLVDPLSRRVVPWALATVLVAAAATGLAAAAGSGGTIWSPDHSAPFTDVRLPNWL